jgi:recombinational DNA repair protein RecR
MNIKYFDNFEGLWKDITGANGQVLQYGVSGWINASISGGTSSPATWGSISGTISNQKDLTDYVQTYAVAKNSAISGATKTKITYDSKGLVTAGTDITGADISGTIDATKIATGIINNTEFNYLDGVSGLIQTQLNSKQDSSGLISATRISSGLISNTEFDFLDNVSGNIQTQLNSKQDASGFIAATRISSGLITNAEFDYLDNCSGNIQTQLNTIQTSANGRGYTLTTTTASTNISVGITYYFGNQARAMISTANVWKMYIPKDGTIKKAYIMSYAGTTTGTSENLSLYIRKNNTTDILIATIGAATALREFTNTALSISVVAGDYIEMKLVCPNPYVTPPVGITFGGTIYIE